LVVRGLTGYCPVMYRTVRGHGCLGAQILGKRGNAVCCMCCSPVYSTFVMA